MRIAQLSDPHLRPPGLLYQGLVDSNAMFESAVDQLNALSPAVDLVLLSGDVVDEGTAAEYAAAGAAISRIRAPVLAIPGNHDDREGFRRQFAHHEHLPDSGPMHFAVEDRGPVRIVAVDVTVPGRHHGDLTESAARWLEETLARAPDRPTIVMLHHPPFESGIACIDVYACRNGDRLSAVISRHPCVERIVCGHIHRSMQLRFGGTLLCTAPSTTTAIALRLGPDAEAVSFVEPPAFLLHHWRPGTGLITHLVPIGNFRGPLPFA